MIRLPSLRIPAWVCLSLALVLFAPASSFAQVAVGLDPYHHTYHPDLGYVPIGAGYGYGRFGYGYGGLGGGKTAAASVGAAAAGLGQEAAGIGQGRLSTAQAQEAHQTATTQYLQNLQLAQDTVLETSAKRAQKEQETDEATRAKIKAQVALYNRTLEQMAAAHRLTAEQMDVGSGKLHWPFVLRSSQYDDLRYKIDQLYDARTPENSGTNSTGFDDIQKYCRQLQELVDQEVKQGLPINDYVTARHFISSIEYEARFPVKSSK